METFGPPMEMVENKAFERKRQKAIEKLRLSEIDSDIRDIVSGFSRLPHCYTIQSCRGHIIEPGPEGGPVVKKEPGPDPPKSALYQIAYLAFVIEDSKPGRELQRFLAGLEGLDKDLIQWGSATWFWLDQDQVNSYVIQVEPYRYREMDRFTMNRPEALKWLEVRELFFDAVREKLRLG